MPFKHERDEDLALTKAQLEAMSGLLASYGVGGAQLEGVGEKVDDCQIFFAKRAHEVGFTALETNLAAVAIAAGYFAMLAESAPSEIETIIGDVGRAEGVLPWEIWTPGKES